MEKYLLKAAMKKRGVSICNLARRSGMSRWSLCLRLWGIREFRLIEMVRIKSALDLSEQETAQIFFGRKVS